MTPAQRQIALRKMALTSIPEDWEIITVGSIAQKKPNAIVGGPFGSDLVSTDYVPAGVPVIRGQNMGQAYVSADFVFVSDEKAKALSSNLAAPGDVIFTQRGTLGQVSVVPEGHYDRYLISQSQMKLSVDPQRFSIGFLCQYFSSTAGQQQILESAIQTGVPHTNLAILRGYFLPRPPLHEQQAIAAALSDADGAVARLERVIAKKRLIKQGAMQDLLTARRRLPEFSGEWLNFKVGSFLKFKNGLNKAKSYFGHGTPIVNYMDVFKGGAVNSNTVTGLVQVSNAEISAYGVRDGDVLFTRTSETAEEVGFASVADGVDARSVFSGFVLRGRPQNGLISRELSKYCFRSDSVRRQIVDRATYTTRALTNGRQLSEVEIRVPADPAEQLAIATALSDMDAEIQTLEARLNKARAVKEGMMQELLTGRVRLV